MANIYNFKLSVFRKHIEYMFISKREIKTVWGFPLLHN